MPSTAALLLLLLLLPAVVCPLDSSHSGPCWCSQELEDVHRRVAGQVLPGPLPRRVPQLHISVELAHQQPYYVLVAVDGSDVERCVPAR